MKRRISRARLRKQGIDAVFRKEHTGGGWYDVYREGVKIDRLKGKKSVQAKYLI